MGEHYAAKRLGRNRDERKRLLRSLIQSFLRHGDITTTHIRAKVLCQSIDKLVSLAKKETTSAKRRLNQMVNDRQLLNDLSTRIVPVLNDRVSGYTRFAVVKERGGDNAQMVRVVWVNTPKSHNEKDKKEKDKTVKKSTTEKKDSNKPSIAKRKSTAKKATKEKTTK